MTSPDVVHQNGFTNWVSLNHFQDFPLGHFPGVYAIAIADHGISGEPYTLRPEIQYFGKTNAKGGIVYKLSQFHGSLFGTNGRHGGGWRFRFDFPNAIDVIDHFFVSIATFDCNQTVNSAFDSGCMGKVLELELKCFTNYLEKYGHLPKYNDPKLRPKKYFGYGPNYPIGDGAT